MRTKLADLLPVFLFILASISSVFIYINSLKGYIWLVPILQIFIAFIVSILHILNNRRTESLEEKTESIDTKVDEVIASFEEIREEKEKMIKYEKRQKLVVKLIDNGLIKRETVFKLIKPREFFFIFCYEAPLADDLRKYCPNNRQPILEIIENIGFIKLGKRFNFYLIIPETLNKKFRGVEAIRNFIPRKFNQEIKKIKEEIKNKDKKLYQKVVNEKGGHIFNYTFLISSSRLENLFIKYYPFNSFSKKFKDYISGAIDLKKLRTEAREKRHEIKTFISSISHDLLLDNVPDRDKKLIINNEKTLKRNLQIEKFTDYARVNFDDLKREILLIFSDQNKAKLYAETIQINAIEYSNALNEMGIIL